jgi:hypothetical protein
MMTGRDSNSHYNMVGSHNILRFGISIQVNFCSFKRYLNGDSIEEVRFEVSISCTLLF